MTRLTQKFEFSAAHRLHAAELSAAENHELFGRCNNPNGHGHNYELEVTLAGSPHPVRGTLLDIADFQSLVNEHVVNVFDHKHLNLDCPDFAALNPTVENIAQVIYHRLKKALPPGVTLAGVKLWETPKTMCEFTG